VSEALHAQGDNLGHQLEDMICSSGRLYEIRSREGACPRMRTRSCISNLALISALEISNQEQYLSNHSTGVCRAGGQEKWTPNSQRWPARIGFQVHGSRVQKADLAFHSSSSTLPKSSLSLTSNSNRTHRWTCCNLFHSEAHQNKLTRISGFHL
jgi:hypothetical protein